MQVTVIHSVPQHCPECRSDNINELFVETDNNCGNIICYDCGAWVQIEGSKTTELTLTDLVCPHCKSIGEVEVIAGEEWCNVCGLNPNVQTYPSPTISFLWKENSDISHIMQTNRKELQSDRNIGKFLRTRCGPHCSLSESCPQKLINLIRCYREGSDNFSVDNNVSKKSRKQTRKNFKQQERKKQAFICKSSGIAEFKCAQFSWFEKVLNVNNPYSEQTKNNGTGL